MTNGSSKFLKFSSSSNAPVLRGFLSPMGPRIGSVEAYPANTPSSKRRKLHQPASPTQTQHPELVANVPPSATITNGSLNQVTVKPAARSTAKFVPLAEIPLAASPTPVVVGTVPTGASILIIQEPWLSSM